MRVHAGHREAGLARECPSVRSVSRRPAHRAAVVVLDDGRGRVTSGAASSSGSRRTPYVGIASPSAWLPGNVETLAVGQIAAERCEAVPPYVAVRRPYRR